MSERIEPHKVTKPIQLLAAWLAGLIVVDASFLSAAAMLKQPAWAPSLLVIAAVCNVPLFLVSLFLLQTRFRPEMQEDSYYSKYLEVRDTSRKPEGTASEIQILRAAVSESNTRTVEVIEQLQTQVIEIARQISGHAGKGSNAMESIKTALEAERVSLQERKREIEWQAYRVDVNDLLPNYRDVVSRLRKARIRISETFGSTSQRPRVPVHYLVTFGPHVSIEALRKILEISFKTGAAYLGYSPYDVSDGRLYVGSYLYESTPVLELDETNRRRILECPTIEDVISVIAQKATLVA